MSSLLDKLCPNKHRELSKLRRRQNYVCAIITNTNVMADIPTLDDIKRLLESQKNEIVTELATRLKSGSITNNTKWLRSKDVRRILCISDGSLRNMRNDGTLSSKKIRGMYFYSEVDVRKMMEPDGK